MIVGGDLNATPGHARGALGSPRRSLTLGSAPGTGKGCDLPGGRARRRASTTCSWGGQLQVAQRRVGAEGASEASDHLPVVRRRSPMRTGESGLSCADVGRGSGRAAPPRTSANPPTARTKNVSMLAKNHSRKPHGAACIDQQPDRRHGMHPTERSTRPRRAPFKPGARLPDGWGRHGYAFDHGETDGRHRPGRPGTGGGDGEKKAAAVEAYESEWYEVLKRRAAELEEAGETGDSEPDDEG